MEIILASQSPRRRELLERMGLDFRVLAPHVDEHMPRAAEPAELVEALSRRKADAAAALAGPDPLIIAADTVVSLDGEILGKPGSPDAAAAMLSRLSGREHRVYTGVTVRRGDQSTTFHETAEVRFRPLTEREIAAYVATGEPLDKAGSYGYQGTGALMVEGITGDYYTVVGLPLCRLGQELKRFGVDLFTGEGVGSG